LSTFRTAGGFDAFSYLDRIKSQIHNWFLESRVEHRALVRIKSGVWFGLLRELRHGILKLGDKLPAHKRTGGYISTIK